MQRIALISLLFLSACAPVPGPPAGEPQPLPPPVVAAPAPAEAPADTSPPESGTDPSRADAAAAPATPPAASSSADSITERRLERAATPLTLLEVIREQGVPDDNIIPGKKEQIAVYERPGKVLFYFFRDNRLVALGEYPLSHITDMKTTGTYPRAVIRDLRNL